MNMENIEILKGMINEGIIPRYVCKYRPILIYDSSKSIFNLLKESYLWFASANHFNDPFDCQLAIDYEAEIEEVENWLLRIKSNRFSYNNVDIKNKAIELYNDKNQIKKHIDDLIQNNGICCFSKEYDNILQWSHYADSHHGVCLVFDILEDPIFFQETFSVDYRVDFEKFNLFKDFNSFVKKRLLPKYKAWGYEKEIRSFSDQIGSRKFQKFSLVKMIFGCNISIEHKTTLIQLVSDLKYPNVEFIQAHKNHSEYKLDFFSIQPHHTNLNTI